MKKPHFLCVAPYEGIHEMFLNYAALQPDIACTVLLGDQHEGAKLAAAYITEDIDGIISRGETANILRDTFSIPVFSITFSTYDLLRAIKSAQSIAERFAVVGKEDITKNVRLLCNLLQYSEIGIKTIQDISETEKVLIECKNMGYTLVVGDFNTGTLAKKLNMQSIVIMSGLESIADTFRLALLSIENIHNYRERENILLKALSVSPYQIALFNSWGELLYSTLDGKKREAFLPLIEGVFTSCSENKPLDLIEKFENTYLTIHCEKFSVNQEQYALFRLAEDTHPHLAEAITIHNPSTSTDTSFYLTWGHGDKITNFIKLAEQYAKLSQPILLIGEYGCEIDQLALYLYYHGRLNNAPMVVIDCNLLTKNGRADFFDDPQSPLYSINHVLYLKNIEILSSEYTEKLLLYLDQSGAAKRNKVFLSYQYISPQLYEKFYRTYPQYLVTYTVLKIPALREHSEDIWAISNLYINELNREYGKQVVGLQLAAAELLEAFPWPQNNEQLKGVLRTALLEAQSPYISSNELKIILENSLPLLEEAEIAFSHIDYSLSLREIEKQIVFYVLKLENMNQTRAAQRLNISRSTLWRMLNE